MNSTTTSYYEIMLGTTRKWINPLAYENDDFEVLPFILMRLRDQLLVDQQATPESALSISPPQWIPPPAVESKSILTGITDFMRHHPVLIGTMGITLFVLKRALDAYLHVEFKLGYTQGPTPDDVYNRAYRLLLLRHFMGDHLFEKVVIPILSDNFARSRSDLYRLAVANQDVNERLLVTVPTSIRQRNLNSHISFNTVFANLAPDLPSNQLQLAQVNQGRIQMGMLPHYFHMESGPTVAIDFTSMQVETFVHVRTYTPRSAYAKEALEFTSKYGHVIAHHIYPYLSENPTIELANPNIGNQVMPPAFRNYLAQWCDFESVDYQLNLGFMRQVIDHGQRYCLPNDPVEIKQRSVISLINLLETKYSLANSICTGMRHYVNHVHKFEGSPEPPIA